MSASAYDKSVLFVSLKTGLFEFSREVLLMTHAPLDGL